MPLVVDIITEDDIDSFVRGTLPQDDAVVIAKVICSDPRAARIWRRRRAEQAGDADRSGIWHLSRA